MNSRFPYTLSLALYTLSLALVVTIAASSSPARAITQPPHDEATHGVTCADCHVPYAGLSDPLLSAGAATAGGLTQLVDDSKTWTAGQWSGGVVTLTSGANEGEFREIVSHTASALSWERPLEHPVQPGDSYQIGRTTYDDIEERCATCHNPTGVAPGARLASHDVETALVRCGKCHDPHNIEGSGEGAQLIRAAVRWPTALPQTVYPAAGTNPLNDDTNPLVAGPPSFDGICETCHTQTIHHRNGPTEDHMHGMVWDCTFCHKHERGFVLDCVDCHNRVRDNGDGVPEGGRRAVDVEFPLGDPHAHFAGELSNADCRVCHDTSRHMRGEVMLLDPDDPDLRYRFVHWSDLSDDPDVSDFCAGCHDADGAQRLSTPFDPFGGGQAPPDVASHFLGTLRWSERYGDHCFGTGGSQRIVNSHHDISASDQNASGARVECLSCHGAHTAGRSQPLGDPDDDAEPWRGTVSDQCLRCHAGGSSPNDQGLPAHVVAPDVATRGLDSCGYGQDPWFVSYTWGHSAHGLDSKRAWSGYSGAPSADLPCTACHDPHGSYTPDNPAGNPYAIRDAIDGTAWVDDGARPLGFNGPPWDTMGQARPVTVSVTVDADEIGTLDWGSDQGLCAACHTDWAQAYSWHSGCSACQTCHNHGATWGEHDWGGSGQDTPCP